MLYKKIQKITYILFFFLFVGKITSIQATQGKIPFITKMGMYGAVLATGLMSNITDESKQNLESLSSETEQETELAYITPDNNTYKLTYIEYNLKKFNKEGYNWAGFNENGIHKDTGTIYGPEDFNEDGFNSAGYDWQGFNKDGYDWEGFDRNGFNKDGIHKRTRDMYDQYGLIEMVSSCSHR